VPRSGRDERGRDFSEGDLDLAIGAGGCPACTLAIQTEDAVLAWLVRENVRDPQTVGNLVRSGGLCGPHWSAVLRRADARATRWVGESLVEVASGALERLAGASGEWGPRCPVCASMDRRVRGAVEIVLGRLDETATRTELTRSFGLCQPHASIALRLERSAERRRALVEIQRLQIARLRADFDAAADDGAVRSATRALATKLAGVIDHGPR
jgi:hypothetical protein